ncbi:hypothetical protein Tco_1136856, partial [Tanacetum coccineum]
QAALKAESSKVAKHEKACLENQHVFIPFAFDTFGFLAPEAENRVKAIESVPSLENVTVRFGMVIDEHFSSLVMHAEFYEEVKSIEIVNSLASDSRLCCTLANLNANLENR